MDIKEILKKNNFHFNKRFGQNFLTDSALLSGIVEKSGADENSVVVEIGCGAGTLTCQIAKKVKKVFGFEIDRNLQPVLKETLKESKNTEIIFKDIMRMETSVLEETVGEDYYVIANLPYYITTPVIMRFITEAERCKGIVVMVQQEVAERLCAKAGTVDYGAITAGVDVVGNASIIEYVGRNKFYPVPNVDSAVVKIVIDKNKYAVTDMTVYRDVVRSAFQSRRKTLVNNFMNSFKIDRQAAEKIISECGISVMARGETLSTEEFVKIAEYLSDKNIRTENS